MAATEISPANVNNAETLTVYESHTETVGLTATGGFYGKTPTGTVSANWSDSWTWEHSKSISVQDWQHEASGDPTLKYWYKAAYGTPDTYDNLTTYTFPHGSGTVKPGAQSLNDLQSGDMVGESETVWTNSSSSGPIGPVVETLDSSVEFVQGEVYQFPTFSPISPTPTVFTFSAAPSFTDSQNIVIDFGDPGLQPPAPAPWTLSFGPWPKTVGTTAKVTGKLTIADAADNPGTINLTYVIQPRSSLQTLPAVQACPGNKTSFIPGNDVVDNNQEPFTIEIPAGKTSVTFPLKFQTFNSNDYNIQVVAWQSKATVKGKPVINPQSAWCLTVPNTTE